MFHIVLSIEDPHFFLKHKIYTDIFYYKVVYFNTGVNLKSVS